MAGLKRFGWGFGYAGMAAFGGGGLWAASGPVARLAAGLLILIGVGGLIRVSFVPWFDRHRPAPVLAVAPSGAPAMFFRRSPFMVVSSLVGTLGLAAWTGALAVVLHRQGDDVTAVLVGVFGAVLLGPGVVAACGKVAPGGLWVTPLGLEHRHEAVSWAVPWADLTGAQPRVTRNLLPYAPGRGGVPVQPVLLALRAGGYPEKHRTARWLWTREVRAKDAEPLVVDAYDLAGGSALIALTITHFLAYPRLRVHLGTAHSLPRCPGPARTASARAVRQYSV